MARLGRTISNVIRGDTRTINLTFLESNGTTPVNLTGGTAYFTVSSTADPTSDATAAIQKIADTFTDATAGEHTFTLTHDDTDIDPGTYWYDAQFVDSDGNYLSSYRGKFIVQSDIART
jgi:hypothetical protein